LSLIIGLCSGPHDAAACLYDDYELLAAVPLERLNRNKGEGRRLPEEAIDELLAIAGAERREVEVVCLSRGHMPARYMTFAGPMHAARRRIQVWLEALIGRERHAVLAREHFYARTTETAGVLKGPELLRGLGFRADARVYAYNHHFAHSLPCLFHNPDWDEALLYTSDAGGDGVSYSHRWLRDGKLSDIFGGDEWLVRKPRIDSIAYVYGAATEALGYKIARHEGKLTGLAAWGEPTLYEALAKRFRIDKAGQIHSDFRSYRQVRSFVRSLAKGQRREDVSASVQRLVEDFTLRAVGILMETYPSRNLGVSGGLFANVRLNQKLIETGAVDRIFVYPAMSDQGLCAGGVLAYLLESLAEIGAVLCAGERIGHQPEGQRLVDRRHDEARIDDDIAVVGVELRHRVGGDVIRPKPDVMLHAHLGRPRLGLGARFRLRRAVVLEPHPDRRAGHPSVARHVDQVDVGVGKARAVLGAELFEAEVAAALREAED
jgi:carbamoyltransferase